MSPKDGLISHLTCLVYVRYIITLGNFETLEIVNLASNFRYRGVKKLKIM